MDTPIKISISILPILEDIQIVLECDILHSQVSKSVNSNHKCVLRKASKEHISIANPSVTHYTMQCILNVCFVLILNVLLRKQTFNIRQTNLAHNEYWIESCCCLMVWRSLTENLIFCLWDTRTLVCINCKCLISCFNCMLKCGEYIHYSVQCSLRINIDRFRQCGVWWLHLNLTLNIISL